MNKTKWGSVLLLLAMAASLNARERREPCCSTIVSSPADSPCLVRPNECDGPNLCPMYPELDCQAYMHFDIGFIYEQMRVTGSEVAYNVCGTCIAAEEEEEDPFARGPQVPWTGCTLTPEFDLSFGVTAALGYYACWDDWYFKLNFDWLQSTATLNKKCDCQMGQTIMPNGAWVANMVRAAAETSGSCDGPLACIGEICDTLHANYYMLEGNINRGSFISLALAIEPYCGMKTVWTDFCNNILFRSQNNPGEPESSVLAFVNRTQRSQFWGIGPEWGVNLKWFLVEGMSLFCDPDVAILFGHTVVKDTIYNDGGGCSPCESCNSECRVEFCNSVRMMSPNLRVVLGFMWDRDFCANTQHLQIKAGLDVNYFWNQYLTVDWVDNYGYPNFRANDHNDFSMVCLLFNVGWDF